ncbi:MAG: hypothetical protein QM500_09755 [Methylococcales bacterium]
MYLLILAIAATVAGPIIYLLCSKITGAKAVLDSFILVVTAGIIIFQVLPETFVLLGVWSIVLAILGTTVPGIIEFLFRQAANKTHFLTLLMGILGLLLHGVIDGSALRMHNLHTNLLAVAILLHRIPISLTLWWLVKPEFGTKMAISVLFTLIIGTVLGFNYSGLLMESLSSSAFAGFQAVVAGTLLHVLYHRPGHDHDHDHQHSHEQQLIKLDFASISGTLLAILVLFMLYNLADIHT